MEIKKKKDELNLEVMNNYYDLIQFAGIEKNQYFDLDSWNDPENIDTN